MREDNFTTVASTVRSGVLRSACSKIAVSRLGIATTRRGRGDSTANRIGGFTLAELVVTVGVLVLLVLVFTQLFTSTASITALDDKRMDADSQARQLLDRMAIDFAQLVKRSDVDFFAKGTAAAGAMAGNDQIAFYSGVPGYYPTSSNQSPVSLVAYRVNSSSTSSSYNKMERMGKGLLWNGAAPATPTPTPPPVVFMPLTISATWPAATSSLTADAAYEVIGPQVFRFEYCYLQTDGTLSITPPSFSSMAAIIVDIAVIDPRSKALLTNAQIATFNTSGGTNFLSDYAANMVPGQLRRRWQNMVNNARDPITNVPLPRPALSAIRLYERYFYLSPPTL